VSALHFLTKRAEVEAIETEEVVDIEVGVLAMIFATQPIPHQKCYKLTYISLHKGRNFLKYPILL